VEDRNVIARFWNARHLARGTPHLSPMVTARRVRRATIEASGVVEFHVDGEPGTATGPVNVEVLPSALSIRIPAR
jgi:diacylglycerol kinase family enzyme